MKGGGLKLHQHFEGQLNKYTNVVKGWQFRWFVLNPDKGTLDYYMSESEMKLLPYKPRGTLHLACAVVCPSDEDSHTFVLNSASGDIYKLRATDAKERQEWITRLRVVSELHATAISQTNSPLVSRDHGSSTSRMVPCTLSILESFAQVTEWLQRGENASQEISNSIDRFPISGPGVSCTDQDVLMLKATVQTTLMCLEECLYALQLQQRSSVKGDGGVSVSSIPSTISLASSTPNLTLIPNRPMSHSTPASATTTPLSSNHPSLSLGSSQKTVSTSEVDIP